MHEWALAEAVLEAVKVEQQARPDRARARVTIRFGELQGIDQEVFAEGLGHLAATQHDDDASAQAAAAVRGGPAAEGSIASLTSVPEFVFVEEPAQFICNACEHSWLLAECTLDEATREAIHFLPEVAHSFIACPKCGSADFRVAAGRGVTIDSIEFLPAGDDTAAGGSDD